MINRTSKVRIYWCGASKDPRQASHTKKKFAKQTEAVSALRLCTDAQRFGTANVLKNWEKNTEKWTWKRFCFSTVYFEHAVLKFISNNQQTIFRSVLSLSLFFFFSSSPDSFSGRHPVLTTRLLFICAQFWFHSSGIKRILWSFLMSQINQKTKAQSMNSKEINQVSFRWAQLQIHSGRKCFAPASKWLNCGGTGERIGQGVQTVNMSCRRWFGSLEAVCSMPGFHLGRWV